MNYLNILQQAKSGRPDLAAQNAGVRGSLRLAALCAQYKHSSGHKYSVRELVSLARWQQRSLA